jgi:hypothetical protein
MIRQSRLGFCPEVMKNQNVEKIARAAAIAFCVLSRPGVPLAAVKAG